MLAPLGLKSTSRLEHESFRFGPGEAYISKEKRGMQVGTAGKPLVVYTSVVGPPKDQVPPDSNLRRLPWLGGLREARVSGLLPAAVACCGCCGFCAGCCAAAATSNHDRGLCAQC